MLLTNGSLNVYNNPSEEAEIIDNLAACTQVQILESTDGFYKIYYNQEKTGYVSKEFITERKETIAKGYQSLLTEEGFKSEDAKNPDDRANALAVLSGLAEKEQYATIKKYVPKVTYGCVAHNRIWCCGETGEEVYASALGKPCEFNEFNGVATDSWSVSVGTTGKFTGIAPWQTRVLVFKEECIQVIYGTTPKDFGIERTYNVGCIDRNSISNAGGMLIWLSYDGFYAYGGGKPERISDKLNTKYLGAVAFSDGIRYYARCQKEDGECELLVFDTEKGIWSKLSDLPVVSGDFYKGKLYTCTQDSMYIVKEGEYGDFYLESPELSFETFDDKSLIYINIRCKINHGFINLYTSVNGGQWVSHKGISKTGKHRLPIRYSSGDMLRFRIEGSGDVTITDLELEILVEERS